MNITFYKLRQTNTTIIISQPPSSSFMSTYVTLPYLSLLKEWMVMIMMTKAEWIMKVHRELKLWVGVLYACISSYGRFQLKIWFPALYLPFYVLALECSQVSLANTVLLDISLSCKAIGHFFLAAAGGCKQQMYSFGLADSFVQRQTLFLERMDIRFKVLSGLEHI